jgi:hypothetical protein
MLETWTNAPSSLVRERGKEGERDKERERERDRNDGCLGTF